MFSECKGGKTPDQSESCMEIQYKYFWVSVFHSSSALCVCGNSAFSVIERERESERESVHRCQQGPWGTRGRDRVVSIWLASCTNGHKELFPQQSGGESSPLRLRDSDELKDSLSV